MIPRGRFPTSSSRGIVRGTISEYTRASRTRRAIRWGYWAPKSTTRTVSWGEAKGLRSASHADVLLPLEHLALGLQGGGHHHLGLLELFQRLVPGGRHRGAQRPEEVERPVVVVCGSDEHHGDRRAPSGVDPRGAREGGAERGHPPLDAPAGGLVGAGEGPPDHQRVGPPT